MFAKTKLKIRSLRRSRTVWLGGIVVIGSAVQPNLIEWLHYRLAPEDQALAGVIIGALIVWMRWITTQPLEDK